MLPNEDQVQLYGRCKAFTLVLYKLLSHCLINPETFKTDIRDIVNLEIRICFLLCINNVIFCQNKTLIYSKILFQLKRFDICYNFYTFSDVKFCNCCFNSSLCSQLFFLHTQINFKLFKIWCLVNK
jgi:hypothetical protein